MLRRGDLYAGRFEVLEDERDPSEIAGKPSDERYSGRIASREVEEEPDTPIGLLGVDTHTRERVRICRRSDDRSGWVAELSREAVARVIMEMRSPWTATVLLAGPGVVFADLPPRRAGALTLGEAAECTLQACDVVARLHAAGWTIADFPPEGLRIVDEGGRPRIRWIVPGPWLRLPPAPRVFARDAAEKLAEIATNIVRLVDLFFSLQSPMSAVDRAALDPERAAELERLSAVRRRAPGVALPPDVASLGQKLLKLISTKAEWSERIEAMPRVPPLPRVRVDWDRIIALGEEHLAAEPAIVSTSHDVKFPVATAYHQRASRSFAQGDTLSALRDAERAVEIDPLCVAYRTTHAILIEAAGRRAEAYRSIDQTLLDHPAGRSRATREDLARAHATRGLIAFREGNLEQAEIDLRRALELDDTAFHAHSLGAVLYARGALVDAATAETRSVKLEPSNTRYRWALVVSLKKLGHAEKARKHAEYILKIEPDVAAHRARFAKLF